MIMSIVYKICPDCGSHDVIDIVYGRLSNGLKKLVEDGKAIFGGETGYYFNEEGKLINLPIYHCQTCSSKWDREDSLAIAYQKIKKIIIKCNTPNNEIFIDINISNREVFYEQIYNNQILKKDFKKVSVEAIEKYLSMLQFVDLLYWKPLYEAESIHNNQWTMTIVKEKSRVYKSGINAYPSNWNAFWGVTCELLSTTIDF